MLSRRASAENPSAPRRAETAVCALTTILPHRWANADSWSRTVCTQDQTSIRTEPSAVLPLPLERSKMNDSISSAYTHSSTTTIMSDVEDDTGTKLIDPVKKTKKEKAKTAGKVIGGIVCCIFCCCLCLCLFVLFATLAAGDDPIPIGACCINSEDEGVSPICYSNVDQDNCEKANGLAGTFTAGVACSELTCPGADTGGTCCEIMLFPPEGMCTRSLDDETCHMDGGVPKGNLFCMINGLCGGEESTTVIVASNTDSPTPPPLLSQSASSGPCCHPTESGSVCSDFTAGQCADANGVSCSGACPADGACPEDCTAVVVSCCPQDPFVFAGSPYASNSPTLCGTYDYNCDGSSQQYPCSSHGLVPSRIDDPAGRTFWLVADNTCGSLLGRDAAAQCGGCAQDQTQLGWACSESVSSEPPSCPPACDDLVLSVSRNSLPTIGQCSLYVDNCAQGAVRGESCRIVVSQ